MRKPLRLLTLTALFTAMTCVLTMFAKIPAGNGYVHLGDSAIYLAACVLPFPYAIFVGAVGGAMSDALGGYVIWIIPTFIIKALNTLPYTSKSEKILTKRNVIMVIPAGMITVVGYTAAEIILFGWAGAVSGMLTGLFQPVGSAVVFLMFAAVLDKIGFKQNILRGARY